jgi:hypothetical protein
MPANSLAPYRSVSMLRRMSRPQFISGLELDARFYDDVVEPLVRPWPRAAALLGWGSDVLGVDTVRSTDHGWGPRMQIFVADDDLSAARAGVDPRAGLGPVDWLLLPQQRILGVVRGAVHADPRGELATLRTDLRWYPHDVWLWLLASCWHRVAQEEAFVGRARPDPALLADGAGVLPVLQVAGHGVPAAARLPRPRAVAGSRAQRRPLRGARAGARRRLRARRAQAQRAGRD